MRISHKYKFIFLSNPRCGSESIRKMLDPFSDVKSTSKLPYHHHASAKQVYNELIKKKLLFKDYTFWTTIRNPFDRLVSVYNYGKKNSKSYWHKPSVESTCFQQFLYRPELDRMFKDGGAQVGPYNIDSFAKMNGQWLVNKLIRLEDINYELPIFLKELLGKDIDVVHLNKSDRNNDYRAYYTDLKDIKRVEKLLSSDIIIGKYKF